MMKFVQIAVAPNNTLYALDGEGIIWHYGYTHEWEKIESRSFGKVKESEFNIHLVNKEEND